MQRNKEPTSDWQSNKALQGIVAVSDSEQIEKIRKEVESLDDIKKDIKYWDYTEVLEVHEAFKKPMRVLTSYGLCLFVCNIERL